MEDKSILNETPQEVQDYLNDLAIAVCINGERLEKYEKLAIKLCGVKAFANMKLFVEEVQHSVEREKFTNTSRVNLGYLGKNAGVSEDTLAKIIKHHEDSLGPSKEEKEFWERYSKYKVGCRQYLKKYPNGKFVSLAKSAIADFEAKEREEEQKKRAEEDQFWNNCQGQDDKGYQEYLRRFPNGKYAHLAQSIIADLEKKKMETAREQAMWKKCLTKEDFQNYLNHYPYGKYTKLAYDRIRQLEAKMQDEQAENELWLSCKTEMDYLRYLKEYPNGIYQASAKSRIASLQRDSRIKSRVEEENEEKKKGKKTPKGKLGCAIGIVLEIIVILITVFSFDVYDIGELIIGFLVLSWMAVGVRAFLVAVFDLED